MTDTVIPTGTSAGFTQMTEAKLTPTSPAKGPVKIQCSNDDETMIHLAMGMAIGACFRDKNRELAVGLHSLAMRLEFYDREAK
jgi:hypothetical protein